jgi:CheY-like chemotaxis protein
MNDRQRRARQRKILAIDDEAGFTRLLKLNLEASDRYLVQVENDSKMALPAALDFRPDLVLMDVMMPGLDGGDITSLFSEHSDLAKTPIIFLTATVRQAEVDDRAGWLGGHRFLAKPVDLPALLRCLDEHFALAEVPS